MNDTEILLSSNITDEEKYTVANNIVKLYELSLNTKQILLAFEKVRYWLNNIWSFNYQRCFNIQYLLLNEVLKINKNMYTAIILALCDNFNASFLHFFITIIDAIPMGIGTSIGHSMKSLECYYKLLDYYDFDVGNIPFISEDKCEFIQAYRDEKYFGKLTKRAIKNE